jgi:hypothetical protein
MTFRCIRLFFWKAPEMGSGAPLHALSKVPALCVFRLGEIGHCGGKLWEGIHTENDMYIYIYIIYIYNIYRYIIYIQMVKNKLRPESGLRVFFLSFFFIADLDSP